MPVDLNNIKHLSNIKLISQRNSPVLLSGTTWSQEIVPLIVNGGDPTCLQSPNWDRAPWLEDLLTCSLNIEERPSPRMFATHLQYNMMPPSFFKVKPRVHPAYILSLIIIIILFIDAHSTFWCHTNSHVNDECVNIVPGHQCHEKPQRCVHICHSLL